MMIYYDCILKYIEYTLFTVAYAFCSQIILCMWVYFFSWLFPSVVFFFLFNYFRGDIPIKISSINSS